MNTFQDILIQHLSTEYVVEKEGEGLWDKCKSLFKIGEKTDDKSQKETKENTMFSFAKMFSHIGLFPQESKYSQERKKMREDNAAKRKELLKSKKDALEDLRIAKMKADNNKTQFLASAKINAEINRIKTAQKECEDVMNKYGEKIKSKSIEIPSPAEQAADDERLKAAMNAATPEQRNMMEKMQDAVFEITHKKVGGEVVTITDPEEIQKRIHECPHLKDTIEAMKKISQCEDMNSMIKQMGDPNSRLGKIAREDEAKCTYNTVQEEQAQSNLDAAQQESDECRRNIDNLKKLAKDKKKYIEDQNKFIQYYKLHPDEAGDLTDEQKKMIDAAPAVEKPDVDGVKQSIAAASNDDEQIEAIKKYLEGYKDIYDTSKLSNDELKKFINDPDGAIKDLSNKQKKPNAPVIPDAYMLNEETKAGWDRIGNNTEDIEKNLANNLSIYNDQKSEVDQRIKDAKKKMDEVQTRKNQAMQRFEEIELNNSTELAGVEKIKIDGQEMTVKDYVDKYVNELTPGETLENGKVGYMDTDGFHEKPNSDSPDYQDYIEERDRHICLQDPKSIDDQMLVYGQYTAKMENGKMVFRDNNGKECTAEKYATSRVELKQAMNLKSRQKEMLNELSTALKDPSKAKSSFIKDIVEHPERNQDFIKTYIDQKYPEVDEPQKPADDASDEEKRKYEKDLRKYEENKKKREELKSDFDDEIDRDGEDADDEEQKADAETDDIDADDNDQDAEEVDGKKKIVNPAKIWHKKKKKNGGTTKSYYNSKDPKSSGISQKEYQEKLAKYKERLAKSKEKTNEEQKQESLSFQELLKFDMLFERYGEQVPLDIVYEYHIDEGKFGEWVKRKKSSLHQSVSNLRNKLKNKFHK